MRWLFQDSSLVTPMAVYFILRQEPIFPAIAGPELIPMRMLIPMRIRVPRGRRQPWGGRDHGENH